MHLVGGGGEGGRKGGIVENRGRWGGGGGVWTGRCGRIEQYGEESVRVGRLLVFFWTLCDANGDGWRLKFGERNFLFFQHHSWALMENNYFFDWCVTSVSFL